MSDEEQVDSARDRVVVEPERLRSAIEDAARDHGWRAAADVFQRHWDLYATRVPQVMLEALKGLPGEVFVERPSMLIAADYLQQVASGQGAGRFHDGARDTYGGAREPRELLDSLIALTGRAAGARAEGALDTARLRSAEARRTLERADESARGRAREALPHLMLQWGRCREAADADGAIVEYEQSHHLGTITGQTEVAGRAAASLAWLLAERGRLSDAREWLARARATGRVSPRHGAVLHLTDALIAADRLDDELAERALARIDDNGIGEYWAALLWVRAMIARGPIAPLMIRHDLVGETERRARKLYDEGANRRYLVRAADAIEREIEPCEPLIPAASLEAPSPLDIVRQASTLCRSGSFAAARGLVRTALAASPPVRDEAAAQLILAASEFALGGSDAARSAFCRAHALIAHEGLLRSYNSIGAADLRALAELSGLRIPALATVAHAAEAARPGPAESANMAVLTRRERELLVLIAEGRQFAQIAESLFISLNTVKTLTRSLYRKLGVHSRGEAAALARTL
jgi:DNA-binding CsgD family transcriptional regulator